MSNVGECTNCGKTWRYHTGSYCEHCGQIRTRNLKEAKPVDSNKEIAFDAAVAGQIKHLRAVLLHKHKKYGDGPILKAGLYGILTKMDIKMERFRNLDSNNPAPLEATTEDDFEEWKADVEDQLVDIANYAILGLLYLNKQLPDQGRES